MPDITRSPMRSDVRSDMRVTALRRRIGRVGVWNSTLGEEPASFERAAAAEIEGLGYGALWIGETPWSKEALTHSAILLGVTQRLVVATGIAGIWSRDATAAANGANTLAEAFRGRFLLGLGVSHAPLVTMRGHDYRRPLRMMRSYLDAMDATEFEGPLTEPPPRVLAALRTRMLELAAHRAQGAHTYLAPPEHTARARTALGQNRVLAPEQAVVLNTDRERAREAARRYVGPYLSLPNYLNHLRELGWDEKHFADGGSDALIDALVVCGDEETIAARIREHHEAGADHVCIQPIAETNREILDQLRRLAPVLCDRSA